MEGIPPDRTAVLMMSRPPPSLPEVNGFDSCPIALATVAAIKTLLRASSATSSGPRWREDAAAGGRRRCGPCLEGDQEDEDGEQGEATAGEGRKVDGGGQREKDWVMAIGFARRGEAANPSYRPLPQMVFSWQLAADILTCANQGRISLQA